MAGGRTVRSDFIEGMKAQGYEYFLEAEIYEEEPSIYEQLCEVKSTKKPYEQATSVIESSDPRERAEGEPMTAEKPIEGFTTLAKIRNFYKRVEITRETIQDHQKFDNFLKTVTKNWVADMRRGKNKFVLKFFNKGALTAGHDVFNSTITNILTDPKGDLPYDGVEMFNLTGNTRTSKGGTTYYNAIASSLTPANFETLWNLMTVDNAFNEDDTEVSISPNLLLVNKSLEFTARRLLESTLIPGSATNDKNVLEGIVKLLPTNYFTDTDGWVLQQAKKGLTFYQSETPVIDISYDHNRKIHMMDIEERYGVMFRNFRFFGASNLSDS